MAFRSDIIGAAGSGLTALVLKGSQVAGLESVCLRCLRVLPGGVAAAVVVANPGGCESMVARARPADVLWRQAGLVPIWLESRVHRLRERQK
eukprot:615590-Pyramimonas_sp.AAC.1